MQRHFCGNTATMQRHFCIAAASLSNNSFWDHCTQCFWSINYTPSYQQSCPRDRITDRGTTIVELQQSQKFLPTQSLNARFYRMRVRLAAHFFGSTTTQRQAAWDYYGCANYPNFVKRNNNKEIEGEPPMKRAKDDVAKKWRGQSSSLRGRRRQSLLLHDAFVQTRQWSFCWDLKDKRVISYIYDGSETLETMFGEFQSVGNDDRDIRAGVAKAEEMWSRNGRRRHLKEATVTIQIRARLICEYSSVHTPTGTYWEVAT
ncbi:hypothetical protein B0H14DRAFT_2627333 [Mycena olivaceomarginata]|nr:hypothetical protein B0H14DRAFT_2627333 [Mycena olivaceomarginata]